MPVAFAVRVVIWLWLLAALAAGYSGWLQKLPPPAIQGVVFALTASLVVAYRRIQAFRNYVDALDLRALVSLHLTRFVGFYFLFLYRKDLLPYAFAVPGGIGDIVVASLALVVVLYPFPDATRLRAISTWNVIGLVDILLVLFTAARLGLSGSRELTALTYLPLSLLPTFLVPLILATHLAIYARIARLRG